MALPSTSAISAAPAAPVSPSPTPIHLFFSRLHYKINSPSSRSPGPQGTCPGFSSSRIWNIVPDAPGASPPQPPHALRQGMLPEAPEGREACLASPSSVFKGRTPTDSQGMHTESHILGRQGKASQKSTVRKQTPPVRKKTKNKCWREGKGRPHHGGWGGRQPSPPHTTSPPTLPLPVSHHGGQGGSQVDIIGL